MKITEYPAASSVAGSDLVLVEQPDGTKKATATQVQAAATTDAATATTNAATAQTKANTAFTNAATADAKAVAAQTDATANTAARTTNATNIATNVTNIATNVTAAAAAQTDATSAKNTAEAHDTRHEHGGADAARVERFNVVGDYSHSNYTADAAYRSGGSTSELGAHLKGIDTRLGLVPFVRYWGEGFTTTGYPITVTIATINTYVKAGFNTAGESSGVTVDTSDSDVEVLTPGNYRVSASISGIALGSASLLTLSIAKNGTEQAKFRQDQDFSTSDQRNVSTVGILILTANDKITVVVANGDGTNNYTLHRINLVVESI